MSKLKRFWLATGGLAAVEFAIILPLMVVMFLGSVEVSNYVTMARRVSTSHQPAPTLPHRKHHLQTRK